MKQCLYFKISSVISENNVLKPEKHFVDAGRYKAKETGYLILIVIFIFPHKIIEN